MFRFSIMISNINLFFHSSFHTDIKKSPRSSETHHHHKDHSSSKKSSSSDTSGSSKPAKGRRRKCYPESKESKKRKMVNRTTTSPPTSNTASVNNNNSNSSSEEHMPSVATIVSSSSIKVKGQDGLPPRKATPSSSPVRMVEEERQANNNNSKKPKIFTTEDHHLQLSDPAVDIGDIHVTNVLDRRAPLVEERGGTPSTELSTNRLSPMIATQPNGGHHREPELPVGNRCASANSWDNPPNKEIPTTTQPPHRDSLLHVHSPADHDDSHMGGGGIIKTAYSKPNTSPTPPESILTPPLSDSAKSQQFSLSSSTGGGSAGMVTSLRQDHTDIVSRTSPLSVNNSSSTYANSSSPTYTNSYAKSFLTASRADLASSHPSLLAKSPTAAAYDMLDSQSSSLKQETALYNAHPRVITAVSSAYGSMAYGNYQYNSSFQQYGTPVNLAAHHTYQSAANPYGDPSVYKNYRSGHEMPMDLSYNNVGGFSNTAAAAMSLLHHGNMTGATGGTTHPYFHPSSKMSSAYTSASDGGLHSIHDKAQVEEAMRIAQQKV